MISKNLIWLDLLDKTSPLGEPSKEMRWKRERRKKKKRLIKHTCAMSSKQLKIYLRASLDFIPVSPSWSSGVCGRQKADVPLKSHRTSPLERNYLHLAHYSLLLLMCSRTHCALGTTLRSRTNANLTSRKDDGDTLIHLGKACSCGPTHKDGAESYLKHKISFFTV